LVSLLHKATFFILLVATKFFVKVEVVGLENIKDLKPPVIVVANHKSYFDHWLLGFTLVSNKVNSPFLPIRFFAADHFFKVWWTGWGILMKINGAFPARKGEGLGISLREPMEILKNRGTVIFYPEGGMVKTPNKIGEPKRGIGALALWSNEKVLPVAIKGSDKLSDGVKIIFGKPFRIGEIVRPNPDLKGNDSDYMTAAKAIMGKVGDLFYNN
jgi:glycerol-3-phosphate dehydrogenase (NAD(P)+)